MLILYNAYNVENYVNQGGKAIHISSVLVSLKRTELRRQFYQSNTLICIEATIPGTRALLAKPSQAIL